MSAEGVATSDQKIDVPDPRPEDSSTTKAELIARKVEAADGDDDQQPPAKKPRSDDGGPTNNVNGHRKGYAAVKPESVFL